MSFIIWYQVEIEEEAPAGGLLGGAAALLGLGLPLKVSNDVFGGSFILDADITITMPTGDTVGSFEMTLSNLPTQTAQLLKDKQAEGMAADPPQPLTVKLHLGYFDEPATTTGSRPVLEGKVTSLRNTVGEDGLARTVIRGQERGGYRLRTTKVSTGRPQQATADDFVRAIAEQAGVSVAPGANVTVSLANFTLSEGNALQALRRIADLANAPLVVRDNTIYLGAAVGQASDQAPVAFSPDNNIVRLDETQENDEDAERTPRLSTSTAANSARTHWDVTVLGHPGLRAGQVVMVTGLDQTPQGTLRIHQVEHRFSTRGGTNGGYTCKVNLIVADPGQRARLNNGVQGVVDRVRDVMESNQSQRPALDVGQIKEYTPGSEQKHLATLDYGQSPPVDAVAPSVETPIETTLQLHNKPLVSPFAFHKCGLIVPVYPKMRALLAHNRNLVNDALISGFLWPENPVQERPQNEAGDYWLCLPTALGADGLPTGKGVNDLTDKSGHRIIQAKALHLFVGSDQLPDIGVRPTPPADNTLIIEHQSGTKITITSDGQLTIETQSKALALTNGSVTLKLDGPSVEVQ